MTIWSFMDFSLRILKFNLKMISNNVHVCNCLVQCTNILFDSAMPGAQVDFEWTLIDILSIGFCVSWKVYRISGWTLAVIYIDYVYKKIY